MSDIEFNPDIDVRARKIISNKKQQAEYISNCVEAEICPVCGASMDYKFRVNHLTCTNDSNHFSHDMEG